jgi:hypothetical protein
MLYAANCSVFAELYAFGGTVTFKPAVAMLLPFMSVGVPGSNIDQKKSVLSILHKLA